MGSQTTQARRGEMALKMSLPASRRDVLRLGGVLLIDGTVLSNSSCGSPPGADADELFIIMATGGQSGVDYPVGSAMSTVVMDELAAKAAVEATGASVDNINLLDKQNVELAIIHSDAATQAYNGAA